MSTVLLGCGDDEDEAVDVTEACNRLEDLGNAIFESREATTGEEVRLAVQAPLDSFVSAADESGDDTMSDFALTVSQAFDVYLTAGGIDAREAGNDVDVAIDRSAARCTQLGASNDFPEQP